MIGKRQNWTLHGAAILVSGLVTLGCIGGVSAAGTGSSVAAPDDALIDANHSTGAIITLPALKTEKPMVSKTPAASAPPSDAASPLEVVPPTKAVPASVSPYLWSAAKAVDGSIHFAGYVPNEKSLDALKDSIGEVSADATTFASGAPKGFMENALEALDILSQLDTGVVALNGSGWSVTGAVGNIAGAERARAAFDNSALKATGATYAVSGTAPVIGAPTAVKTPVAPEPTPVTAPETETSVPAKVVSPAEAASAVSEPVESAPVVAVPGPTPVLTPVKPVPAKNPAAPAVPEPYVFNAARMDGGAIAISGDAPTEGLRNRFSLIAGNVPFDAIRIRPGAPDGFVADVEAGISVLSRLDTARVNFDGKQWSVTGKAATPDQKAASLTSVEGLPDAANWHIAITAPTAAELCTTSLTAFNKVNPIDFDSGRARMAKGGAAAITELAADLAVCPDEAIDVEGYTDSDGDANANMALSVARSEAVVAALIKAGIKQSRLYAIGYGEGLPLVPNTSRANKQKNRRIEVKIHATEVK